jgi:hypothetical protein
MIKVSLNHPDVDKRITDLGEYYSIHFLWSGLEFLNELVKRGEEEMIKYNPRLKDVISSDSFEFDPDHTLINFFVWYANSSVNLLKLLEKTFQLEVKVQDEFSQLFTWRHKVAAHFSYVEPRRDSKMIVDSSIMQSVGMSRGRYYVGQYYITEVNEQSPVADNTRWRWSLTDTHEKIAKFKDKTFQDYLDKTPRKDYGQSET